MQAGEKRFARRLESHLEDDYLCWYEVPVGSRQRYPDFIVLHPARGLLLEVKDWKLDTIRTIDRASVTLLTPVGLKTVSNPLEQVRQCTYQLLKKLETDSQLVNTDGRHKGKLAFPWGFGVVFTNITRAQFLAAQLQDVLPGHQVICKDEMTEAADPEDFQQRLWNMFNVTFNGVLTLPQIDRIRWHLFPEIRIGEGQAGLFDDLEAEDGADALIPDLVRVMDMQQEQLARSLGSGHRVIHGVAGSGKTLILGYRCLHLAQVTSKPILVVCFNITLAARLRGMMVEKGINDRVHVYHFHDWCGEQVKRYHVSLPRTADYLEALVPAVIAATDKGQIPRGQYGALMIDEGHDFEEEWLRLIVQMVDPDEGSLLLLYDDAQSIYKRERAMDFSLSSVGIQARGRTTILKLNYRNTDEILNFAYRFAREYLAPEDSDEDHVPLVEPQAAGRHGPRPHLRVCASFDEEAAYIAHTLRRLNSEGQAWREMCVCCPSRALAKQLANRLAAAGIPVERLVEPKEKQRFDPAADSVKLMTMHSSKGLEFSLVVIPATHTLGRDEARQAADAKLLYVAMTRSMDKLLLTASAESGFAAQLGALVRP